MQLMALKGWMRGVAALCYGVVTLSAQTDPGHKPPQDLWLGSTLKKISAAQETEMDWRGMISAFARNDEKTGLAEADIITLRQNLLTPQQVELLAMLVQLGKMPVDGTPPDPEIDRLKDQASQALAEADTHQLEFDRLKAQADQLPKGYSPGSTADVKMVQLNNAAVTEREKKELALQHYQHLRQRYEARRPIVLKAFEKQISSLLDHLEEKGQIAEALALCKTYLRKNSFAAQIAARSDKLLALEKKEAHALGLVSTIDSRVKSLLEQHRLSTAQKELTDGLRDIRSSLRDSMEWPMVKRFLDPLSKELDDLLVEGGVKVARYHRVMATDPGSAAPLLTELKNFWQDCPDLDEVKPDILQSKAEKDRQAYDSKFAAIAEMVQRDHGSAKQQLREFEKSLKPEETLLLKDHLSNAWQGIWGAQIDSIRTDWSEAHKQLNKIHPAFTLLVEHKDRAAIRAAVRASGAAEYLGKARGFFERGLSRINLAVVEIQDSTLRSRADELRLSIESSLELLDDAEMAAAANAGPPVNPMVWVALAAAVMIGVFSVVILAITRKRRAPSEVWQ